MKLTHRRRPPKKEHQGRATRRQLTARLMLIGMDQQDIARKLHCTPRNVRTIIASPAFAVLYAQLERDYIERMDRKIDGLLDVAVLALYRLLRHPDPWVRHEAIEKVMRIHGKHFDQV